MRRSLSAMCLSVFACTAWAGSGDSVIQFHTPGVLDEIKQKNPDHYQRITAILDVAARADCGNASQEKLLAVRVNAKNLQCSMVLKTSFPAQREVSFTLDDQRYVGSVRVDGDSMRMKPLKPQ
ncbi:MAG: hypothetical protein ACRCV9_14405 [Burkholderiaceae bacterium]